MGDQNFGGPGRIALVACIAECGSITQAAKAIKMSCKAAWDAIDGLNNLAGEPLVERLTGGKGGGGTRLTRAASSWRKISGSSSRSTAGSWISSAARRRPGASLTIFCCSGE